MEIGSPQLLSDHNFIHSLAAGFIVSTLLVGLLSLFFMKYIIRLLDVPFWIYAAVILSLIVWSNLQYTHGWQDLAMLGICSVLGLVLKHFKISRPAVLTIYIIAAKLENYIKQTTKLYQWNELITRPLFLAAITLSIYLAYRSFRNKGIDYA
jgi:TctA family transporter